MKKINIDGLLALNLEEIEIVYRRCRGDTVKKVSIEMDIAESTIWNLRIPSICKMLDVGKWEEIEEELRVPLRSIIPSIESLRKGWPEAFREKIEALREPSENQKKAPIDGKPLQPTPPTDPSKHEKVRKSNRDKPVITRPLWPYMAIPLLILCALIVLAVSLGGQFFQSFVATAISRTQVVPPPIPSELPQNTDTPLPTLLLSPTLEPTTTPVPSATPTRTPSLTSSPTKTPLNRKDTASDERVSLKITRTLLDAHFTVGFVNYYFVASFDLEFENHSGETILLRYDGDSFSLTDDARRHYDCVARDGTPHFKNDPVSIGVGSGETYIFTVGCGKDEQFGQSVTFGVFSTHDFSSLGQVDWVIDIPK